MIEVQEYLYVDGNSPFADWFDELNVQAALKVNTYLTRTLQKKEGVHLEVQASR